jgi:hypothetical protein
MGSHIYTSGKNSIVMDNIPDPVIEVCSIHQGKDDYFL